MFTFASFLKLKMNQLPQIMQPPMGVVPPQLTQVSMMPGTGMFFPPPPLGMHLGMTPGILCVSMCECVRVRQHSQSG